MMCNPYVHVTLYVLKNMVSVILEDNQDSGSEFTTSCSDVSSTDRPASQHQQLTPDTQTEHAAEQ